MNRMKLLGAAGLAASVLAAPAFAATTPAPAASPSAPAAAASTAAPSTTSTSMYARVGQGGYMADQRYIQDGNNNNGNNNNTTARDTNDSNARPSQRNPDLADNGSARASKVIGTDVYNTDNQKLGSVNDILLGKSGVFAVISTNQKKVAVPFDSLKFGNSSNEANDKLVLPNETQAKLNTQYEFHYNEANYQAWKASHKNDNGRANNKNNNAKGNGPLGNGHILNNNENNTRG
ncbi:MAG: PRC-barrel domain-containing protein [Acetobacteraceae bacterium]